MRLWRGKDDPDPLALPVAAVDTGAALVCVDRDATGRARAIQVADRQGVLELVVAGASDPQHAVNALLDLSAAAREVAYALLDGYRPAETVNESRAVRTGRTGR